MEIIDNILNLLNKSYSCYHVVSNIEQEFIKNGFIKLEEEKPFNIQNGKSYYVKRNSSSIIGFKLPSRLKKFQFKITASHSDSPTFKIKPEPIVTYKNLTLLNVEPYGGGIYHTFFDRALSIAGRVIIKNEDKIYTKLLNIDNDLLVIPSLAIHMNRQVNSSNPINPSKDTLPLLSNTEVDFNELLKSSLHLDEKEDILSFDLFLYNRDKAKEVGLNQKFILSPKEDDLASAYSSLTGFLNSTNEDSISIYSCFDNEEVGSLTYQGANSTFLKDILERISLNLNKTKEEYKQALASSFLVSIDNGHANHPNYPEYSDKTTSVELNQGIVIKYSASQTYTSSSYSSSLIKVLCKRNYVKYQEFTNRSDLRGGSTLGNLSNSEVSLISVDIGLPQLAMHSANELCGKDDINDMINLVKAFYSTDFTILEDGFILD